MDATNDALALLPADLQRLVARADHWKRGDRTWELLRAELLRLAGENAELRSKLDATERGYERWKRSAEGVGAELAQVRTERDALRARIEGAPTARVNASNITQPLQLRDADPSVLKLHGKSVSLVVRDD